MFPIFSNLLNEENNTPDTVVDGYNFLRAIASSLYQKDISAKFSMGLCKQGSIGFFEPYTTNFIISSPQISTIMTITRFSAEFHLIPDEKCSEFLQSDLLNKSQKLTYYLLNQTIQGYMINLFDSGTLLQRKSANEN
jgi:hypothetical protein